MFFIKNNLYFYVWNLTKIQMDFPVLSKGVFGVKKYTVRGAFYVKQNHATNALVYDVINIKGRDLTSVLFLLVFVYVCLSVCLLRPIGEIV